jgi:hypothetical protein
MENGRLAFAFLDVREELGQGRWVGVIQALIACKNGALAATVSFDFLFRQQMFLTWIRKRRVRYVLLSKYGAKSMHAGSLRTTHSLQKSILIDEWDLDDCLPILFLPIHVQFKILGIKVFDRR